MMYLLILNWIKKPSNVIITVLSVMLVLCFLNGKLKDFKIKSLGVEILELKGEVERVNLDRELERKRYEDNLMNMNVVVTELKNEITNLRVLIENKNIELKKENDRIVYWKNQYTNKICVNNDQEVVKPTQGVINNEANIKVVSNLNSLFLN